MESAIQLSDVKNGIHLNTKVFRSTTLALTDKIPYLIQQGGTSSGKTFNILLALFEYCLMNEQALIVSIVAETFPVLKKGAIRDFDTILAMVNYDGGKNKSEYTYKIGKSTFEFFAVDNAGKAKSGKRDILFINECNHVDYEIVYQLALRTRQTVIYDYNPSAEFWLHTEFLPKKQPGEYLFKVTTYKDNPALEEKIVKDIEALPPDLYRIYGEGKLGQISGLIFDNFDIVDEFPDNAKSTTYGLDFGFSRDPTAMVKVALFDNCIYVQELIYETGLTTDDIDNIMTELGVSKSVTIHADSSEPRLIHELYNKGWYIKGVTKGADSVRAGINKLKRFKICITRDSTNLIKEFRNYKWKEKDGKSIGVPIDMWNHGVDALRYATIDFKAGATSDVLGWA
jgi:phage terminase large subunit